MNGTGTTQTGTGSVNSTGSIHTPLGLWFAIGIGAALMMLCAGCGTSQGFKRSIGAGVNNVVQDCRELYIPNDKTIDDSMRADRLAKVYALEKSVADQKVMTLESVSAAWDQVNPFYRAYIAGDPSLDPMSRSIRLETPNGIDRLIARERERQSSFLGSLFPAPSSSP